MEEIGDLYAFIKVIEKKSFTAAASALNCSTSSISKKITQLEHAVGAKLLNRSTHGMANLTEAGMIYFGRVRKIIYELESAKESARDVGQSLQGTLKVHITPGTGLRIAVPAILQFMKSYPSLSVDISVRPESYDILRQGFDVSICNISPNDPGINYSMVEARELVKAQYAICASPSYFEKFGRPSHPRELTQYNCLVSIRQPSPQKWWFRLGRKKFAVKVQGTLVADNGAVVYEAAKAGMGIARILRVNSSPGPTRDLEPIFSDLVVSDRTIHALIPRMRPLPRKIEAFVAFMTEELQRRASAPHRSS
jgi:DNA-binding transcriptional LysR family regulator